MTQEEKAKAYDEALEKIREGLQPLPDGAKISGVTRAFLEEVFPELAESEDEKIRKELITWLQNTEGQVLPIDRYNAALAWLEKQGDNNNQNWKPSKGQINALEHFVRSIGESCYASPYDDNTNLLNSLINDLYKLEKQGEQKPAWSEEDEENLQHCCMAISADSLHTYEDKQEMEVWLKRLKDRIGG